MSLQLLPIDRRWISQELAPYLRCAFSHAIPVNADISGHIQSAIEFCMHKPDYPTDGDDILFERICQAIEFRHLNFAPDLRVVTENLEPLAKFLIRRAQLKGPYDLLGRKNIASDAWREEENAQLEKFRDRQTASTATTMPLNKLPPTENTIDPRLVHSQQGHFVLPEDPGILTVAADRYYRHQNQLLVERRRSVAVAASWQQQLQQAATQGPAPTVQSLGRGWSYNDAPFELQDHDQRHSFGAVQSYDTAAVLRHPEMARPSIQQSTSIQSPYRSFKPVPQEYNAAGPAKQKLKFAYQQTPVQQPHHRVPSIADEPMVYQPASSNAQLAAAVHAPVGTTNVLPENTFLSGSVAIPAVAIAQFRGNDRIEQAQQRVHEFSGLSQHEKAQKLMQLHQAQAAQNSNRSPFPAQAQQPPRQQPIYPQIPMEASLLQATQTFANHPGFSNVRSTFPNIHTMAGMAQAQLPPQQCDANLTGIPFGTDSRWE